MPLKFHVISLKALFSSNENGVMVDKKRVSYDELFFSQYGKKNYKEDYAGYLLYTISCSIAYFDGTEIDRAVSEYIADVTNYVENNISSDKMKEYMTSILSFYKTSYKKNTNIPEGFHRTLRLIQLLPCVSKMTAKTVNAIKNILIIYMHDKKRFLEFVMDYSLIVFFYIDALYYLDDGSRKHLSTWKSLTDLPEGLTNASAYYHAKTIEFYLYMDSIKQQKKQPPLFGDGMFFIPISNKDDIPEKQFPGREMMDLFTKEVYANCIADDIFMDCIKNIEEDNFEKIFHKDYDMPERYDNWSPNEINGHMLKASNVYRISSVIDHTEMPKDYVVHQPKSVIKIALLAPIIMEEISSSYYIEHTKYELVKGVEYELAKHENERILFSAKEETKKIKKELKEKKQEIVSLKGQLMSMQAKIDKAVALQNDTASKQEVVNELSAKLDKVNLKNDNLQEDLDKKNRECKTLLNDLEKLSKDYKALNAKVYTMQMNGQMIEPDISDLEMAETLNRYSILIVGGTNNIDKYLKEQGFTSFKRVENDRKICDVGNYDLVVICTKFCSHALSNSAISRYDKEKIIYFNNSNSTELISEIYSYIQNKEEP